MRAPQSIKNSRKHVKRKCPECGHHKVFLPKGKKKPQYKFKCCKCNHIIK